MKLASVVFITLLTPLSLVSLPFAENRQLTLVYKDAGKPPYMEVAPDNSGLYTDLMSLAAKQIGFELVVLRAPKKRTYAMLEAGEADLYASVEFQPYRSEYLFFFPNGLQRHEVYYGLTHIDVPNVGSISDLNTYNLEWQLEAGSSWVLKAQQSSLNYRESTNINIDAAIEALMLKRPFFYQVNQEEIALYEQKNNIRLSDLGIKIHRNCCATKEASLFTAFSRVSPWYSEKLNPNYNAAQPLSPLNFPTQLAQGSIAWQFSQAMQKLIQQGKVEELKLTYGIP